MSNPYFQFKQFTIWHDKCAMKVGTDGVLLGAWAEAESSQKILDIGTWHWTDSDNVSTAIFIVANHGYRNR